MLHQVGAHMALSAHLQPQQLWGELEMETHTGCTPDGWRRYSGMQSVPWTIPGLPQRPVSVRDTQLLESCRECFKRDLAASGAAVAAHFPQPGGLQRATPQVTLMLAELLVGAQQALARSC